MRPSLVGQMYSRLLERIECGKTSRHELWKVTTSRRFHFGSPLLVRDLVAVSPLLSNG